MVKEEREELIFICSMMTNYSGDYLKQLTDDELIEIYNSNMNLD
ncbi:BH0509 family protein [Ureibacillus composti]|nr:BH0509 family protein [Ureibacillus composti]